MEDKPWFAPKRYGYGSGFPMAWQGWVALAVLVGGAFAAARFFHGAEKAGALAALILGFCLIAARKTAGGWRWRWGGED
jgi:hypothetical protein